MLLNVLTLIRLALLHAVAAQTATTTTSAPAATYTVSVGADGFNFSPHTTNANVGDIIQFRFYPQNHSVARAAFGPNPCIPYEDTGEGLIGFWSGFQPVALVLNNPPIFNLRVNDTQPIFYYCSAPGACLQGMIGVINPNATETWQQQFNYTQNATTEFSPLQYFPAEVPFSRTTTATGATATPTAPPTTSSTAPASSSSSHSSLGTGPIIGIAIGGFAVLVLAAALIYMCGRQKTFSEILRQSNAAPSPHTSYQPTSPGLTEAKYSNMHNSPEADKAQFTNNYNMPVGETDSYRSLSPPLGNGSPGLGVLSPNSPGFPNTPYYNTQATHEMDNRNIAARAGLRPYNPVPENEGPHELPSNPTDSPSNTLPSTTESRPFSYTDSETGFSTKR